jgi:hypothetical protein
MLDRSSIRIKVGFTHGPPVTVELSGRTRALCPFLAMLSHGAMLPTVQIKPFLVVVSCLNVDETVAVLTKGDHDTSQLLLFAHSWALAARLSLPAVQNTLVAVMTDIYMKIVHDARRKQTAVFPANENVLRAIQYLREEVGGNSEAERFLVCFIGRTTPLIHDLERQLEQDRFDRRTSEALLAEARSFERDPIKHKSRIFRVSVSNPPRYRPLDVQYVPDWILDSHNTGTAELHELIRRGQIAQDRRRKPSSHGSSDISSEAPTSCTSRALPAGTRKARCPSQSGFGDTRHPHALRPPTHEQGTSVLDSEHNVVRCDRDALPSNLQHNRPHAMPLSGGRSANNKSDNARVSPIERPHIFPTRPRLPPGTTSRGLDTIFSPYSSRPLHGQRAPSIPGAPSAAPPHRKPPTVPSRPGQKSRPDIHQPPVHTVNHLSTSESLVAQLIDMIEKLQAESERNINPVARASPAGGSDIATRGSTTPSIQPPRRNDTPHHPRDSNEPPCSIPPGVPSPQDPSPPNPSPPSAPSTSHRPHHPHDRPSSSLPPAGLFIIANDPNLPPSRGHRHLHRHRRHSSRESDTAPFSLFAWRPKNGGSRTRWTPLSYRSRRYDE